MKRSRSIGKEPGFLKIVLISAVLHLLFISLVAIPIKIRGKVPRSYYVTLVGPVQAPHTDNAPLTKAPSVEPVAKKESTAKKIVTAPAPRADITLEEIEMVKMEIERIRAINTLTKKLEQEKKKPKTPIQIVARAVSEEPVKASDIPHAGEGEAADSYYSLIKQQIEKQWVYPNTRTSGLEVIISIKIDKDGKIISQKIETSSGDVLFDRSAMKAISKIPSLPPPPEGLDNDIVLNFIQ